MKSPSKDNRFQYQPGEVMKAARITAGMSRGHVARAVRVAKDDLAEMERGEAKPSPAQWFLFCELVQIPEDSYFEGYSFQQHRITLGLPEKQIHYSRIERLGKWIKENCLGLLKKDSARRATRDATSSAPKTAVTMGETGLAEETQTVQESSEN